MIAAAEELGAPVRRESGSITVETVASVTSTIGDLEVDASGRVAPGVYAAGDDAAGIATGGYASGLGGALVLGRLAARAALEDAG
jgi:predicted oxidoreductase